MVVVPRFSVVPFPALQPAALDSWAAASLLPLPRLRDISTAASGVHLDLVARVQHVNGTIYKSSISELLSGAGKDREHLAAVQFLQSGLANIERNGGNDVDVDASAMQTLRDARDRADSSLNAFAIARAQAEASELDDDDNDDVAAWLSDKLERLSISNDLATIAAARLSSNPSLRAAGDSRSLALAAGSDAAAVRAQQRAGYAVLVRFQLDTLRMTCESLLRGPTTGVQISNRNSESFLGPLSAANLSAIDQTRLGMFTQQAEGLAVALGIQLLAAGAPTAMGQTSVAGIGAGV